MKKDLLLKDLDSVCRGMIDCIQSAERMISENRISKVDAAEKMSGMVVTMRSLLSELQQNGTILTGETERLKAIAQLTSSCENLEGMIKEVRNDLSGGAARPPAKDR